MALGVTDTSQTGPSYSPLGTPLSSASCVSQGDSHNRSRFGPSVPREEPSLQLKNPDQTVQESSYPAASFYPLVDEVGERFPGHVASRPLGGVEGPLLQDDLALADDYKRPSAHLCALEDVVLHSLRI